MRNRFILIVFLGVILLCEIIAAHVWSDRELEQSEQNYEKKKGAMQLSHEKEKQILTLEYEKQSYLASGESVYERIYNAPNQPIADMLAKLAQETLPKQWESDIRVEEFTNCILLIRLDVEGDKKDVPSLLKYLYPLIDHGYPYLTNIAVFNKNHKCHLFFDEQALKEIKETKHLNEQSILLAKEQGLNFRRYNSIEIPVKVHKGHIYVFAQISGELGVEEVLMMLDTGASISVISPKIAVKTGADDLLLATKRRFMTAKGSISCPIVRRKITLKGVERLKEVGVSEQGGINLLGVDFFEGLDYLIDSSKSCIYVWSR